MKNKGFRREEIKEMRGQGLGILMYIAIYIIRYLWLFKEKKKTVNGLILPNSTIFTYIIFE